MHRGLLEDDAAIQEMLHLILQEEGYSVVMYPTAESCLAALDIENQEQTTLPVDLMIVDWRLNGLVSGTEVIQQIRSNPRFDTLPIILTTAATFTDTESLKDMHVTLLEKPFSVDGIIMLIKQLTGAESSQN